MLPSLTDLSALLAARPGAQLPAAPPVGVSTDSRALAPGELFFALAGENHDGHDHVAAALAAGAVAAVVSRRPANVPETAPLLLVEDTLRAYGQLAAWVRAQYPGALVLGLTGSTGKTTTKALAGSILTRLAPTLVAEGNQNNEIGVPRTLLQLDESYRYCLLEFGMRGRGEIAYLAEISRPQIGLITNIGASHLGRLGGREAIAQSKAELLTALPPEGRAVLPADDFFFGLLREMPACPVVSFGLESPEAEVRAERVNLRGLEGSDFELVLAGERLPVSLSLPGRHNILNALAAAALVWAATGSTEGIREGLEQAAVESMRGEVLTLPGPLTVINDAYNASPTSVAAAVDLLASLPGRRILVLGDMLELGQFAAAEHRQIGLQVARQGVDWLVTVGPAAAEAATAAREAGAGADSVEAAGDAVELLRGRLQPGDVVLVKGSRRMALEQVVEGLKHVH
ncbi:MAG TPA: UDP-N-acetylmuramoyl-tripeptide--D-alanyl-D-alanine ligase [Armatimonadota bacterium]|jgi:UDP-N-acetylmuramoyl-tripeptide--D-alanyl-D-alanine ligase